MLHLWNLISLLSKRQQLSPPQHAVSAKNTAGPFHRLLRAQRLFPIGVAVPRRPVEDEGGVAVNGRREPCRHQGEGVVVHIVTGQKKIRGGWNDLLVIQGCSSGNGKGEMFSESSPGHWFVLQRPCCPSKQDELSENLLKNLSYYLMNNPVLNVKVHWICLVPIYSLRFILLEPMTYITQLKGED